MIGLLLLMEMIKMKIGFIGTGVMGSAMAKHLMDAGHDLFVYNRTKSKTDALVERGAVWCEDVETVAKSSEVIFTIIGMPDDVYNVYLGAGGIVENASAGTIIVDMTTSSPTLAKQIYDVALEKGIYAIDAPVTGGDVGAKNATLTIFVGGDKDVSDKVMPCFEIMGKNIVYLGAAGSGQHGKMVNQIAISGAVIGMVESLTYAKNAGIDLETIQAAVSTGAGGSWQMSNMAPRAIAGDFDPGFFIKHFIKDMRIAVREGMTNDIELPGLKLALAQYEKMQASGFEDLGTQGLFKLYND